MTTPVEFVNPVRTAVLVQRPDTPTLLPAQSNFKAKGVYVPLQAGVNQLVLTWNGAPYLNLTHRTADGNITYNRIIDEAPEGTRRQAVINLNCGVDEDFFIQTHSTLAVKDYRYKLGIQITNMSQITAI